MEAHAYTPTPYHPRPRLRTDRLPISAAPPTPAGAAPRLRSIFDCRLAISD